MNGEAFSPYRSFRRLMDDFRIKYCFLSPDTVARAVVSSLCDIPMSDVAVARGSIQSEGVWSDKVHGLIHASSREGQTTVDITCGSYQMKSGTKYNDSLVKRIPMIMPVVQVHCDSFADGIDDNNRLCHTYDTAIIWIDTLDYARRINLHRKLPFCLLDDTLAHDPTIKFYGCPVQRILDIKRSPHGQRMNALLGTIQWFCSELSKGILSCGFEFDTTLESCYKGLHGEEV